MTSSASSTIVDYAKSTQNVSMCLAVTLFLIIVFMMTPLSKFVFSSIFGNVIILTLLAYTIYYNTTATNNFMNRFNISLTSGDWDVLKTNIMCSYIFSAFLLVLFLSVVRKIF